MTSTVAAGRKEADWLRLPHAEPGNRIGLLGGSFNPPHSGHRLVALTALKRLGLDQIWWFVTPGNPLKDHGNLAPLEERVRTTLEVADHPRMKITAHEAVLGSPYTARTVEMLQFRRPELRFVWVMGADNLASFHHWQNWQDIVRRIPIAVVNRPGASLSVLSAPMAKAYENYRLPERNAGLLTDLKPPVWTFIHAPLDETSSTALRSKM